MKKSILEKRISEIAKERVLHYFKSELINLTINPLFKNLSINDKRCFNTRPYSFMNKTIDQLIEENYLGFANVYDILLKKYEKEETNRILKNVEYISDLLTNSNENKTETNNDN